jgi:hypothetical protein
MKKILFGFAIILIASCTKDTPIPPIPVDTNTNNPLPNPSPTPIGDTPLFINEFMAKNTTVSCPDSGNGNYKEADWIEIYNPNNTAINLGGYYLTDSLPYPTKYQIPTNDAAKTTIAAKGYLLFWCDSRPLGAAHATFSLSKSGEQIALVKPDGTTFIDSLSFVAQTTDVSSGRVSDGANTWKFFSPATPGASNQ